MTENVFPKIMKIKDKSTLTFNESLKGNKNWLIKFIF